MNDRLANTDTSGPEARAAMLGRVREALKQPTDAHVRQAANRGHTPATQPGELPVLGASAAAKQYLPFVGPTFEEKVDVFRQLSEKLQTEFWVVENAELASTKIRDLIRENGWTKIGVHHHPLVDEVTDTIQIEKVVTNQDYEVADLESCDAGVSGCESLIAQTASVLITGPSSGGRALSVLPPHHVVVARQEQMVATMADGYERLHQIYQQAWPSFMSFITGPSRTADIERVLVLGAHGPKRLTVILIAE